MKRLQKGLIITLIIIGIIVALFGGIYANHRIRLSREKALLLPLGQLVMVDGHRISLYTEGDGDRTLVFMSGGGTCSPILDFRTLYSRLSGDYRIVVVEKLGYGFSDHTVTDRDIASVLSDTRGALSAAGITGPYVLCPHSMSGIEALYWAQSYPDEVEAIIGLDMALPAFYADMEINMSVMKLGQFGARSGIIRLLPGVAESDAIRYGTLTDEEKEIYRAVFYSGTATEPMLAETQYIKQSAAVVDANPMPQIPMLLFCSDGTGTSFDTDTWRGLQHDFAAVIDGCRVVELDCPHYVHDHEYERISRDILEFLG